MLYMRIKGVVLTRKQRRRLRGSRLVVRRKRDTSQDKNESLTLSICYEVFPCIRTIHNAILHHSITDLRRKFIFFGFIFLAIPSFVFNCWIFLCFSRARTSVVVFDASSPPPATVPIFSRSNFEVVSSIRMGRRRPLFEPNCSAILTGNENEIRRTEAMLYKENVNGDIWPVLGQSNTPREGQSHIYREGQSNMRRESNDEEPYNCSVLYLIHNIGSIPYMRAVVNFLYDPADSYILLFKSSLAGDNEILSEIQLLENVLIVDQSEITTVEKMLHAVMSVLVSQNRSVLITLSTDVVPLKSRAVLKQSICNLSSALLTDKRLIKLDGAFEIEQFGNKLSGNKMHELSNMSVYELLMTSGSVISNEFLMKIVRNDDVTAFIRHSNFTTSSNQNTTPTNDSRSQLFQPDFHVKSRSNHTSRALNTILIQGNHSLNRATFGILSYSASEILNKALFFRRIHSKVMVVVSKSCLRKNLKFRRQKCFYGVRDLQLLAKMPHLFASPFDLQADHISVRCLYKWNARS